MKHIHHLKPRYMGGTDAPENLIEVSKTRHAMFHFCNFQLWGNTEDKIAWRALSGQISFDDATHQAILLGGDKAREVQRQNMLDPVYRAEYCKKIKERYDDPEYRERMAELARKSQNAAMTAALSEEAREKRLASLKRIGHQQGEKNSMYGMMWITDGTREGSRRIPKTDPIPDGFRRGRVNPKNYR